MLKMSAGRPPAGPSRSAPGSRSPWIAVLALAVGSFVLVTSEFMPIGLLSSMASAFSVPEGRAGLLVTVPGLAAAAGAPLTAVALSRLDRRRIMLGLTTAILTSNALVTMTSTFEVALAGRVLLGLGSGGFWVVGISAAARLVSARSASHAVPVMVPVTMQTWMMRAEPGHAEGALSLFVAIAQLSLAVGAAAGGVLVDHLGLVSAFRTGGILSLTATLATIAVLTIRRRGYSATTS